MEWGQSQNIPAVRRNHPPPDIPFYVAPYLNALDELQGSRINTGHGVNQIPFGAKLDYAFHKGIFDVDAFLDILTAVDTLFVTKTNLKIKQMVEKNG